MSEKLKVSLKAGVFDDLFIFDSIKSLSKEDVIFDSIVDDPGLLSD